jgi:hypothetical protein
VTIDQGADVVRRAVFGGVWMAALLAGCGAAVPEAEPEAPPVVELPPAPILDPTLGFVHVRGVVEEAVVTEVREAPPEPTRTEAEWHAAAPWELTGAACRGVSDGARRALLTDPRRAGLMEAMTPCATPAWCRIGRAAVEATGQPDEALAIGVASCPGHAIDAAFRRRGLPRSAVAARLRVLPRARITVDEGVLGWILRRQVARDVSGLPRLLDHLSRGGHGAEAASVLVQLWQSASDAAVQAAIGRSLGVLADPSAQGVHQRTCEDWSSRDHTDCVDVHGEPWPPGPELAERLRIDAALPGFELRVARFDRDWPRRGEALAAALEGCALAPPADLASPEVPDLAATRCLQALVDRDVDRARAVAGRMSPPRSVPLRGQVAALTMPGDQALVDHLIELGMLPEGTPADALPPGATVVDRLLAEGRAVSLARIPDTDPGYDHGAALTWLLGMVGADEAPGADRVPAPVSAWRDGARISAFVLPYRHDGGSADASGVVAFVNAVLAHQGAGQRLWISGGDGPHYVVVGPGASLARLVREGHLATPELTPTQAAAWSAALEVDTGSW